MHREVDERIPQPPIALAIVVLARALGQRLQRGAQRGAADLVEDALDEAHTIVSCRQGQAPRLDALLFFVHETLRVGRMPRMQAGVAEGKDVELARLPEQLSLVEATTDSRCGPRYQREVGKADLTHRQRACALYQSMQLIAGANAIASGTARHVTNLLEPGDRAVEALLVVFVGGGELTRQVRELELDQVTDDTDLAQLEADLLLGPPCLGPAPEGFYGLAKPSHVLSEGRRRPLRTDHDTIIRTSVCTSIVCDVNFRIHENKACSEHPCQHPQQARTYPLARPPLPLPSLFSAREPP